LNGILADEMGLGKTCQTISFLAYLIEQQPAKMHLIIVPSSTLDNWSREIQAWLPNVNYRIYSGSLDERRRLRRDILKKRAKNPINIILTTYSYVHSQQDDRNFFQRQLNLEYSVYDEAHMLKNMNTLRYKNLLETRSKRRLLLTGTPLQNNLIELISLLFFVMPDVFQRKSQYLKLLFKTRPADSDFDQFYNEKIEQAKGIMRPFILRRLKSEVLKDLPDKLENVIYCDMTEAQSNAYNDMVDFFKERVKQKQEKTLSKSSSKTSIITIDSHDSSINEINNNNYLHEMFKKKFSKTRPNVMMELRVVANHPLLRRFIYTDDILKKMAQLIMKESPPETVYQYVLEDLSVLNDYEVLFHFLPNLFPFNFCFIFNNKRSIKHVRFIK
jgi:SWI/SNF-related matrix-associated actin-dependent regulator 1 of chromatin subfamily A